MEKRKKTIYTFGIIGLLLIVVIFVMIMIFSRTTDSTNANIAPSLSGNPEKTELDNSLIMDSKDLVGGPVNKADLLGNWKAITEEVKGIKTADISNYTMTFDSDDTYSSVSGGFEESGKFLLQENNITFYDSGVDPSNPGSYNKAFIKLENNYLTLTYPSYPKVVIYIKS